ncbi:Protein CBG19274 [Caenorhabditis briggsae]|uniref:Protein CBG19274 n=1 Tax=Caenorhabditis briggsae TaxID=6238 RepID=A8XV86_CAEBR|nr:Protein CBG19274 [Caenorhabditis briggsae]CAP36553.2 Protein CBG19274 [Caenorhabditis briggsae]
MSNSSLRSDCSSSSAESLSLPPLGPVAQKKPIQYIGGSVKVDKEKVAEWTNKIGRLFGTYELRQNVTHLHMQLIPAIHTLNKASKFASEKLKKEMKQLVEQYIVLAVACEQILEKMEKKDEHYNIEDVPDGSILLYRNLVNFFFKFQPLFRSRDVRDKDEQLRDLCVPTCH